MKSIDTVQPSGSQDEHTLITLNLNQEARWVMELEEDVYLKLHPQFFSGEESFEGLEQARAEGAKLVDLYAKILYEESLEISEMMSSYYADVVCLRPWENAGFD